MYRDSKIGLVIPAYREEKLIRPTLEKVPSLIDLVYVVDDASPDDQARVVLAVGESDRRVKLLRHETNQGPGGSIITGYKRAAEDGCDIVVVVGGDNQMNLDQVSEFLDPIVEKRADYVKGNRFLSREIEETFRRMPKIRFLANWIITGLTKTASGYYKVMDVVDGYTAINSKALKTVDWDKAWKKYGYPMDFLIRLNAYGFKVLDVPRTAIYLPGERQSQIKGFRYMLTVSPMLIRGFFWRLSFKYLYRDFHPIVFFYIFAVVLIPLGFSSGLYLIWDKLFATGGLVTAPKATFVALTLISGFQFLLFAMLFDMQESR